MEELMAKYLANELSEKERVDFELQLVDNEEIRDDFENYLNLWDKTAMSENVSFDSDSAWNHVSDKTASQERTIQIDRRPRYTFFRIAATLLIVLTAGYFLSEPVKENINSFIGTSSLTEFSTKAEMKEFQLPDGSSIKLNANSKISFKEGFGVEHRNISLTGAANFDVSRNESLPFIINAASSQVEVLGTSFDVSAYPNQDIELNVSEGQVKFSSVKVKGNDALIKAGEMAVLAEDGSELETGEVKDQNFAAWWTRKLVFDNTPLSEVVKDLEKTYWVKIDFDKALKACQLTATYENETLDVVLEVIESTFADSQLKAVRIKENQIKLEGKVCAN